MITSKMGMKMSAPMILKGNNSSDPHVLPLDTSLVCCGGRKAGVCATISSIFVWMEL
jgi:hypothetical protein